jgi:hypothetical protein
MVTVVFKNNSGRTVEVIHQRKTLCFFGGATVTHDFESSKLTDQFLADVKRRYPAIQISLVDKEGEESPPSAGTDAGSASDPVTKKKVTLEEFSALVKDAMHSGTGWWTVTVEGVEKPFKVQAGKNNKEKAIEMAFSEYCEGVDE